MAPDDGAVGVDDKDTALLPGVTGGLSLAVSSGDRAAGVLERAQAKSEAALEAGQAIAAALRIREDGEADRELLNEVLRHGGGPVADHDNLGTGGVEGIMVLVEASDLLAAEQSAIVADKDQDRALGGPQVLERVSLAIKIENGCIGKCLDCHGGLINSIARIRKRLHAQCWWPHFPGLNTPLRKMGLRSVWE